MAADQVDWANAPDAQNRRQLPKLKSKSGPFSASLPNRRQTEPTSSAREMEIDDDDAPPRPPTPPPKRDPRDDLQDQLVTFLDSVVPSLVKDSVAAHNRPTNKSIHADPNPHRSSRHSSRLKLPPVSSTEWEDWPLHESVLFLAQYPPPIPSSDQSLTPSKLPPHPSAFPEKLQSALQSLAALVRKDRRGREFGRGDWERASTGLVAIWPSVKEPFAQAVKDVFEC